MLYFTAKMQQIRFRLGLRTKPPGGAHSAPNWIQGVLLLREEAGKKQRERKTKENVAGKGEEWSEEKYSPLG